MATRLIHVTKRVKSDTVPGEGRHAGTNRARPGGTDAVEQPALGAGAAADQETAGSQMLTELMATGAIGMWKNRDDIQDSSEFARQLRERAQTRTDRRHAGE